MCYAGAELQTVIQWQSGRMCHSVAEWQNVLFSSRVAEIFIPVPSLRLFGFRSVK